MQHVELRGWPSRCIGIELLAFVSATVIVGSSIPTTVSISTSIGIWSNLSVVVLHCYDRIATMA